MGDIGAGDLTQREGVRHGPGGVAQGPDPHEVRRAVDVGKALHVGLDLLVPYALAVVDRQALGTVGFPDTMQFAGRPTQRFLPGGRLEAAIALADERGGESPGRGEEVQGRQAFDAQPTPAVGMTLIPFDPHRPPVRTQRHLQAAALFAHPAEGGDRPLTGPEVFVVHDSSCGFRGLKRSDPMPLT